MTDSFQIQKLLLIHIIHISYKNISNIEQAHRLKILCHDLSGIIRKVIKAWLR